MATVRELYNAVRTAAITYRRSRTSTNRDNFLAAYGAAKGRGVPFLDQDFGDLLKGGTSVYREPAPRSDPPPARKKRNRESEAESELESMLVRAGL
jgi:hypothetical protein